MSQHKAVVVVLLDGITLDDLNNVINEAFGTSGLQTMWFRFEFRSTESRETDYLVDTLSLMDVLKLQGVLDIYRHWLIKIGVAKPMADRPILDTGARREFETGSRRDVAAGKGRYDLLPFSVIDALAKHFEKGAAKYGDRNWEKGQPLSVFADSGLRHAFKGVRGESDEDHIIAAIWNFMAYWRTQDNIRKGELPIELGDAGEIRREQTLTKDKK